MGWHSGNFVLPKETIKKEENGHPIVLQGSFRKDEIFPNGSLKDWQENIGQFCVGNSKLILAICTALASVLIKESGLENGGIHFVGPSSIGKSIALKVAASIWGNPGLNGFVKRWRSTVNGLELLAISRCDSLLILDELGEIQPKDAGLAAYILGGGQSKARSTTSRTLINQQEWRLLFLSSGEIGLGSHINSEGGQVKAGQEVRLIDIPADSEKGFGIFECIHNFKVPNEFAVLLSQNTEKYFGTPILTFIKAVMHSSDIVSQISTKRQMFIDSLDLVNQHSQIYRVAQRFSLLSAAGELGIEFGVLPFETGMAQDACLTCFKAWQSNWGCAGNKESQQIIQQIRKLIQEYGPSRFPRYEEIKQPNHIGILWGFRVKNSNDEVEWFVLNEVFRNEFCRGFELRNAIKALKETDLIKMNPNGESSFPFRAPYLGATRVIKLKPTIIQ